MNNFPKIETERLVLNKLKLEYVPLITSYMSHKEMSEHTLTIPNPYHEKHATEWIERSFEKYKKGYGFVFGIFLKDNKTLIGAIDLNIDQKNQRAVFGYWIATNFWNNGYMTEALKAIISFGFNNLQLNKIYANHLVENVASGFVMQKAGMILEGEFKEHHKVNGVFRDMRQYRILKSEFEGI